ncbi:MAG TPA: aldehyde ferredoxin oxidoreductase family protein [Clostridia bacterium]|nr:aldehyde ferredoxin oxidoreductase family protein [Clostridia bacterium]
MMKTTYNLKLLRIDLSKGTIKEETIDKDQAHKFIGGRGLATKWLYDDGIQNVDALSEDNKLIFITGPLTGSNAPTAGRYMVVTKAPLNGLIGSANSGGVWGAKLKYAGYDALIVEGKSEKPVYINIDDENFEILDASEIWGKTSIDVDAYLKQKHGNKTSALYIGPAGENQSLLSCIINDKDRAAGRGGMGAVMGSKNLKAISVKASRNIMEAYDVEAMKEAFKLSLDKIRENPVTSGGLPTYGTAVLVNIINNIGAFPTKNWQLSYFEDADKTSGEAMVEENVLVKNSFCHRCPIGCGRVVRMEGQEIGGPEYEPLWAYGGDCFVSDLEAISEANHLCNEYGLDAIGAPCTIAAAMELYQRGYIKEEELGGVSLDWGEGNSIIEWTRKMGKGDGALAKLMADGSFKLCEHYGAPEFSMSSKKQELPAYDARAIQGIGLNYATSNRGGCHVRGYTISPEILGLPVAADRTIVEGKAGLVKVFQDLTAVIDALGLCLFTSFALGAPEYTALYNAATGSSLSVDEVMEAGERIYNIERQFNLEAGMKAEEDTLPNRLLKEPIANGPSKGMVSRLDEMLPEYYELRGWVDAFPTEETLKRLGLK